MYGTRHTSSGCYTLDTYHTRLDQRLNAVAKADLSEDVRSISARLWRRLPRVKWGPRQPGRRPTGGHETNVIMLPGQAQAVLSHQGILHQGFEVGDVAVSANYPLWSSARPSEPQYPR